ncbi:hypothetical protein ACIQBJ_14915 [Kitasatospora sp. NPDC088391]|uniref:hypothetical protein n=1 Tax=Kitasatospora sp. NPDC088391 TaxID=3364074 RepID=UPI003804D843
MRTANRAAHENLGTLLIGTCPGPPACGALHSYLFVDGLDLITRTNATALGAPPADLLRPGGPLHPTDRPRTVRVTVADDDAEVRFQLHLRGRTVIWSDLAYPDADGHLVEEVRFDLPRYLAELERAALRFGA